MKRNNNIVNSPGAQYNLYVMHNDGTNTFTYTANTNIIDLQIRQQGTYYLDNIKIYSVANDTIINKNELVGEYRYGFNGMERDNAVKGRGNSYTTHFRQYDPRVGRWLTIDPKMKKFPWQSTYVGFDNNPIIKNDPSGASPDDWVLSKKGKIYWDKNANNQATTKKGDKYLGKTLTFKFNSYIDKDLWDGPNPPSFMEQPPGNKLTTNITLTSTEDNQGNLTGISVSKLNIHIGETPVGTARDYYPGLGSNQNEFYTFSHINLKGRVTKFALHYEQHASVSPFEEFALNAEGFDIVNVAQKLQFGYSGGILKITAATDIFPSATLSVNGIMLFRYDEPSFVKNFKAPIIGYSTSTVGSGAPVGRTPLYDIKVKSARWFIRFPLNR